MNVTLLFPPATDPRAPHLALPALAACLRQEGNRVDQIDLDLGGLLALLHPDALSAAGWRLRSGARAHLDQERRSALLRLCEGLAERVGEALRIIRDPVQFYQANDLAAARATIDTAVAITSSAMDVPLHYSLEPIRYDVQGYDTRRLRALIQLTALRQANIFSEYWADEVMPRIEANNPALVGISLANRQQLVPGLMLARALKERGYFVILGGTLLSKFADGFTRWPEFFQIFADGVVVFEGETALRELTQQLDRGRDFSRVPNFRYLEGDTVRATTPYVENIDSLPTPDFAGLPLDQYLVPRPVLPVCCGKGCYYSRCKFCDIPHINRISQQRYRRRNPGKVVDDIRSLEHRFGARHFVIADESLSPEALCELAEAFGDDRGSYSFTAYARLEEGFTPEACCRIGAMGVRKLFFGLESAAQRTLDHMRKGTQAKAAPAILRACRDAGIHFHLFSMIGLPQEDEGSARETFEFFLKHRDIIDHPGNSFDIHRFGLDTRAGYFSDREQLGLSIDTDVSDKEFMISLSQHDWHNRSGLSPESVLGLLHEFESRLRYIYARHHNAPRHLWPPFEEHAVLYCDHFRNRKFPYATALPDATQTRFSLRLSPACVRDTTDHGDRMTSYWSSTDLPRVLTRALTNTQPRTVAELVRECVSTQADRTDDAERLVRQLVHFLLGQGMLQLELLETDNAGSGAKLGPSGAAA